MPRVLLIGVRSDPEAAISKRSQFSPCEDTQCWCLGRPIQVNRWWNFDIGALQGRIRLPHRDWQTSRPYCVCGTGVTTTRTSRPRRALGSVDNSLCPSYAPQLEIIQLKNNHASAKWASAGGRGTDEPCSGCCGMTLDAAGVNIVNFGNESSSVSNQPIASCIPALASNLAICSIYRSQNTPLAWRIIAQLEAPSHHLVMSPLSTSVAKLRGYCSIADSFWKIPRLIRETCKAMQGVNAFVFVSQPQYTHQRHHEITLGVGLPVETK